MCQKVSNNYVLQYFNTQWNFEVVSEFLSYFSQPDEICSFINQTIVST